MSIERRKVINRDGIVEDLNIEKIREKLLRACDGLEVNMVEKFIMQEVFLITIFPEQLKN